MTYSESVKRRRFLFVWIVAVATGTVALAALLVLRPLHVTLVGLDVTNGLAYATYLAVGVTCATTFGWLRAVLHAPRVTPITVRGLSQRAHHGT